jgi:hypothetical protein
MKNEERREVMRMPAAQLEETWCLKWHGVSHGPLRPYQAGGDEPSDAERR